MEGSGRGLTQAVFKNLPRRTEEVHEIPLPTVRIVRVQAEIVM
jgi:hypothetical protein